MPMWNMVSMQDSNSIIMEYMVLFYDLAMTIIIIIMTLILYMMNFMIFNKLINRKIIENQYLEFTWTLVPMFFLLFLAIPSLVVLYTMEDYYKPSMTVKAIGHQWYWSYEYPMLKGFSFDSFSSPSKSKYCFRNMDVDNRMCVPTLVNIRLIVTSVDVIHSFAVPSMGLKVDAIPGRLNQAILEIFRPGVYYGQCSEICGVNHSFMPIVIESASFNEFIWILCMHYGYFYYMFY